MTDTIQKEIDDLRIFSDPFEPFQCDDRENGWTVRLVRGGRKISLVRDRDRIRMISDGVESKFVNFASLLNDRKFADLERFAQTQNQETRLVQYQTVHQDNGKKPVEVERTFIAPQGDIVSGNNKENRRLKIEGDLFENFSKKLRSSSEDLRVFVINGVAGVGKTLLIQRLARERSLRFSSDFPLLLHVKILGKVLTALDDLIAGTLLELKAGFFGNELKPLVRRDLVHVAIDGFDGLSDSQGSQRAWGALKDFTRDLGGKGTLILAGRDTMLNWETVRDGLGDTVKESAITLLNLDFPEPRDIRTWLSEQPKWNVNDNRRFLNQIERQMKEIEYLRRPFFVSEFSKLAPSESSEVAGDPIAHLMGNVVDREVEKLLPREGERTSVGSISDLYTKILSEAAGMMMDDESDSIDVELLRLIAEEVFVDLNEETKKSLVQRVESFALFEKRKPSDLGDDGVRVFPHETIRSYFYSKHLLDYFPRHGATTAMYRVPLSSEELQIFNGVVRSVSPSEQKALRRSMKNALETKSAIGDFSSNLGGLLLSFMPFEEDQEDFVLSDLQLRNAWMTDPAGTQRGDLINLQITRLVAENADLSGISFRNVEVYEMFVGPSVKFGDSMPNVKLLNLRDVSGRIERIFDVSGIEKWIAKRRPAKDLVHNYGSVSR